MLIVLYFSPGHIFFFYSIFLFFCCTVALPMWFCNVLLTLGHLLPTCWRKVIKQNVSSEIVIIYGPFVLLSGAGFDNSSLSQFFIFALQVDIMIGVFFVNFNPMLKEQAKVHFLFHRWIFFLGYAILVVILAMEDRRMLMSSWGSYYWPANSLTYFLPMFHLVYIISTHVLFLDKHPPPQNTVTLEI